MRPDNGLAIAPATPGTSIVFDRDKLGIFKV